MLFLGVMAVGGGYEGPDTPPSPPRKWDGTLQSLSWAAWVCLPAPLQNVGLTLTLTLVLVL